MTELRIIFMGTPEFSIPSLEMLIRNKINVVAVITAPDKPRGRGRKLSPPPVKQYAQDNAIPVLQPVNLKHPEFIEELKKYKANLQIVVAFRMLPEIVWSMPGLGTFNLHASLLPQYRGAAPINWAIINGETKTGLTTFFIKQEIDTGNIIFQEEEPIYPDDDAGTLHDRLMVKGGTLVLKTVRAIQRGKYDLKKQTDESGLKKAPKLTRENCEIDWNLNKVDLNNFIRGLSPFPAAWTRINGAFFKIFKIEITDNNNFGRPGEYTTDRKTFIDFHCSDGVIRIRDWQPEGKRRMTPEEFFRGNTL